MSRTRDRRRAQVRRVRRVRRNWLARNVWWLHAVHVCTQDAHLLWDGPLPPQHRHTWSWTLPSADLVHSRWTRTAQQFYNHARPTPWTEDDCSWCVLGRIRWRHGYRHERIDPCDWADWRDCVV